MRDFTPISVNVAIDEGVTLTVAEAGPVPKEFDAVTEQTYRVPFVSGTVIGDEPRFTDTPLQLAVYILIESPPDAAGGVKEMIAWPLPAVPVPIVGAPGTLPTIPKLRNTCAGRKVALPAWVIEIVQVPSVNIVTLAPTTEQTVGDWVPKVTGRPDDAVADIATGVELNCCVPGFVNVII